MFDRDVVLRAEDHRYFHNGGAEYRSVSKVLRSFEPEFDSEKISYYSAKKELKLKGISSPSEADVVVAQERLKAEWSDTNKAACDVGTYIHDLLEHYGKTTVIKDAAYEVMIRGVYSTFSKYKVMMDEQCLHYDEYLVAGTADKLLLRPGTRNVIDIVDYKTNLSKGIVTSSKYGNRMKKPFDHLEHCNFVTYTLQLSMYALMVEMQYGYKVGSLTLIYIPPNNPSSWKLIPISYMKYEAMLMMKSADGGDVEYE